MSDMNPEQYLEPVSKGICEALNCSSGAVYRASRAQGVVNKLKCSAHKTQLDGKVLQAEPINVQEKRLAR